MLASCRQPQTPLERSRDDRRTSLVVGLVWTVAAAAVTMFLSTLRLLPDAPDKWTYDWRTALVSERLTAQRDDIAVVMIGEETVARYASRSPIDRQLVATLLDAIDQAAPQAIGLDIILDRPTEPAKDAALLSALHRISAPVVLGAIDGRTRRATERQLDYQERFIAEAGKPAGHLYFAREDNRLATGDQVVRFIVGASTHRPAPGRPGFSHVLAGFRDKSVEPASPYIAWLRQPNDATPAFLQLSIPEHDAGSPPNVILPESWRASLKDRIVLVGGDFIDRDGHLTPFSVVDGARMQGVLIHAQILAQLLDGRSLRTLSRSEELALLVALAGLGYWLGHRYRLKRYEFLVWIAGLAVLVASGTLVFALWNLILPSASAFSAWVVGLWGGHYADALFSKGRRLLTAGRAN